MLLSKLIDFVLQRISGVLTHKTWLKWFLNLYVLKVKFINPKTSKVQS